MSKSKKAAAKKKKSSSKKKSTSKGKRKLPAKLAARNKALKAYCKKHGCAWGTALKKFKGKSTSEIK